MMTGTPATAGDMAHVWLMSHPAPSKDKQGATVRSAWKQGGASDSALDFWLQ